MINLLPPELKEDIRYARKNRILLKWAVMLTCGVLGIVVILAGGWLFIRRDINSYNRLVSDNNDQLKAQKLDQVQSQADTISNNLKLVVKVLSREVLFSKLLQQIGTALPNGVILTSLNITQVQGGLDLQAAAIDYQTATQIQVNLQDPHNQIFSKADIVSILCQSGPGSVTFSSSYPCKVQIRAQFTANNPFLYINSSSSQTQANKP